MPVGQVRQAAEATGKNRKGQQRQAPTHQLRVLGPAGAQKLSEKGHEDVLPWLPEKSQEHQKKKGCLVHAVDDKVCLSVKHSEATSKPGASQRTRLKSLCD